MKMKVMFLLVLAILANAVLPSSMYAQDSAKVPVSPVFHNLGTVVVSAQANTCQELIPQVVAAQVPDKILPLRLFLPLVHDSEVQFCPVARGTSLDGIVMHTSASRTRYFAGYNGATFQQPVQSMRAYSQTIMSLAANSPITTTTHRLLFVSSLPLPAHLATTRDASVVGPVWSETQRLLHSLDKLNRGSLMVLAFHVKPGQKLNTSAFPLTPSIQFGTLCPGTGPVDAIYEGTIPGLDVSGHVHFWSKFSWPNSSLGPCANARTHTFLDEAEMLAVLSRVEHKVQMDQAKKEMANTVHNLMPTSVNFFDTDGTTFVPDQINMEEQTFGEMVIIGLYVVMGGIGYYVLTGMQSVPMVVP